MTQNKIQAVLDHKQAHHAQYLDSFLDMLRIPSISTDPAYKDEVIRCADWVIAEMDRIGFKNNRKIDTGGHPIVYGEWLEAGDDQPTVLVYAHYDVQPVDPLELWDQPPFEPHIQDGKIFARGAIDDKCGVSGNLNVFESMFAVEGKLPFNVKLLFEGEEEIGSPNVQSFVAENKDLLQADALILCDGPFTPGQSVISASARGIVAAEITVIGPDHDLHSGSYGGAVHNPLHLLGKIIGSFHDETGRIQIPHFYDAVKKLSEEDLQAVDDWWQLSSEEIKAGAGVTNFWASEHGSILERTTALPTLDINGMTGGYQGPGMKTIIPSEASCKVTMRLVADQNPHEIAQLFTDYVQSFAVETLDLAVNIVATSYPMSGDLKGALVEAKTRTSQQMNGKAPLIVRSGGSLPIGGTFQHELGFPMIGLYFGAGDNVHAPNEFIRIEDYHIAIDTAIHFYYNLADTLAQA